MRADRRYTMKIAMLTTDDNPFNPHHDWESWYMWDETHGYHTTGYLARLIPDTTDPSSIHQSLIDDAIDEVISMNLTGNYVKIYEDGTKSEN